MTRTSSGPTQDVAFSATLEEALLALASSPEAEPPFAIDSAIDIAWRALGLERVALWVESGSREGLVCRAQRPRDATPLIAERRGRGHAVDGADEDDGRTTVHVPVGSAVDPQGILACERPTGRPWSQSERIFVYAVAQTIATQIEREKRLAAEVTRPDPTAELAAANEALSQSIAEYETARAELTRRSDELEGIFRTLPDLYFRLAADGTILQHRSGTAQGLYLPAHRFIGKRITEIMPADVARLIRGGLDEVAATGRLAIVEYPLEVDMQRLEYEARILPLPDGSLISIVRDITARKRAERALKEREEHFRTLIENAHDITCICDESGRMLYQSPSMERRLGYKPEELIGKAGYPYIHPEDLPRVQEGIARMANDPGSVVRLEYRFRHKDGSWRMLEAFGRTLLTYSSTEGVVLNIRDITERMQSAHALEVAKEEADRARDAAERANRAKSEFLSRMSHELRTPMNSILGFAQLLDRAEIPAEQRRGVQHILRAGRHLLQLINEVLEIARIEAGRQDMSLEPVQVQAVLAEAIGLVKPLAAQRNVVFEEGPTDARAFVHADRQRLVQVLLNLLSNAVKYNRPSGRVRITCSAPDARGGGRIAIRVEDTGRGIPADRRDDLFTPFARLGAEQSEIEGTGLGLALSLRLTEAMGGALTLERSDDGGSTFRLDLNAADDPMNDVPEATIGSAAHGAADFPDATLLYIEDNLANLTLVESILLSRPTWRTIPALQGQLGVELAREHSPDLVLLDLHLPDISGEEVLRRLRADPRTAAIPIVVISADATTGSRERLRKAGANGYLTKPLDVDEFLTTIGRFIQASAG